VQIARAFTTEVDNMLQVTNPIQINVEVSFVEITSGAARNLGVQLGSATLLTENVNTSAPTIVPGTRALHASGCDSRHHDARCDHRPCLPQRLVRRGRKRHGRASQP
jgi:hypothetical protein